MQIPILPKIYSQQILLSSIITLGIPFFYGIYKKQYMFSSILLSIILSSINYWKDPVFGTRRTIDQLCVRYGIIYQNYTIWYYNIYPSEYYFIMGTGIVIYYISGLYNKSNYKISCKLHILFHILVCFANINILSKINICKTCHFPFLFYTE